MTREEVKKIIFIITNEYPKFLPDEESRQILKIDTWYVMLINYDFKMVQIATMRLLKNHKYSVPVLANLFEYLEPKAIKENKGQEFADKVIYLLSHKGVDRMSRDIEMGFGEIGKKVFMDNKDTLRTLNADNVTTYKAQIRDSFNSAYERHEIDQRMMIGNENESKQIGVS